MLRACSAFIYLFLYAPIALIVVFSLNSGNNPSDFQDFGVDFRIGKDEIDYHALRHIISEYVKYEVPDAWREDLK